MNVINVLGTVCDLIGGFLIARYLEDDMKKEISAEIKKVRDENKLTRKTNAIMGHYQKK